MITLYDPTTDGNRTTYGDYITIGPGDDLLEAIRLMAKQMLEVKTMIPGNMTGAQIIIKHPPLTDKPFDGRVDESKLTVAWKMYVDTLKEKDDTYGEDELLQIDALT